MMEEEKEEKIEIEIEVNNDDAIHHIENDLHPKEDEKVEEIEQNNSQNEQNNNIVEPLPPLLKEDSLKIDINSVEETKNEEIERELSPDRSPFDFNSLNVNLNNDNNNNDNNNNELEHKPSKQTLKKLLGMNDSELEEAIYLTQLAIIENERDMIDQQVLKSIDLKDKKVMEKLGITKCPSMEVLEKMLGISSEHLITVLKEIESDRNNYQLSDNIIIDDDDDDYRNFDMIDESEFMLPFEIENAISSSSKVQQLLGISPQQVKLMKKLGLSHSQLLAAQARSSLRNVLPPLD